MHNTYNINVRLRSIKSEQHIFPTVNMTELDCCSSADSHLENCHVDVNVNGKKYHIYLLQKN
jgi:hypothetical protein